MNTDLDKTNCVSGTKCATDERATHQVGHLVGLALHNATRAGDVERETIAPLARVDAYRCFLLTEERFFAEREQDRPVVLGRMVEDVCVLVGLFRETTTIENLETLFTAKEIVIYALRWRNRLDGCWEGEVSCSC